MRDFLLRVAREIGARAEAEDLAQTILENVARLRERDALSIASAAELELYLASAMRKRHISVLRRRRSRLEELKDEPDRGLAHEADGPDGSLRFMQYFERSLAAWRFALSRAEAPATTMAVVERMLDRHAFGNDPVEALRKAGLVGDDDSADALRLARNTENRRQSRARKELLDALHQLDSEVRNHPRAFDFEPDEVRLALRLAMGLCRCEKPREPNPRASDELT